MQTFKTKTELIIFSICLIIIAIGIRTGIIILQRNRTAAIEEEMTIANAHAADMAAEKLAELDFRLSDITGQIVGKDYTNTKLFMDSLVKDNSFLAMRIFYRDGRVICSGEDFFSADANTERAFRGETVIGSLKWNRTGNFVLRSYKPIDQDRVLAATLSGQYISSIFPELLINIEPALPDR